MKKIGIALGAVIICTGAIFILYRGPSAPSIEGSGKSTLPTPRAKMETSMPVGPSAPAPSETTKTTSETLSESARKIALLKEILQSKNDNDPRLDSELSKLTWEDRQALQEMYSQLPKEQRNELGTIVFLIGRSAERPEDFHFLEKVLLESPCLSLSDCRKEATLPDSETHHLESGNETTLAYPQRVALQMLEAYLDSHPNLSRDASPELSDSIERAIQGALDSPIDRVRELGRGLRRRFKNRT